MYGRVGVATGRLVIPVRRVGAMGKAKKRRRLSGEQEVKGEDAERGGDVEEVYRRYAARQYDEWMCRSVEENAYGFPDVTMLFAMADMKRRLWKRYGFFYDVETIREVYPENELAGWVRTAFERKEQPRVIWRDNEMSYEWANDWCEKRVPSKIRSYEEEVEVQLRRRRFRELEVAVGGCETVKIPTRRRSEEELAKQRLTKEEERRIREEKEAFWRRRRNPVRAQHDAGEPDQVRWDALQRRRASMSKVRKGG